MQWLVITILSGVALFDSESSVFRFNCRHFFSTKIVDIFLISLQKLVVSTQGGTGTHVFIEK